MLPIFNVDGSNLIEQQFLKTGDIESKRTNMDVGQNCSQVEGGVDLNRNYGFMFGQGDAVSQECGKSDTYSGMNAFSEPETRAMK